MLAAARAPQRVRSLTLIEPPVHLVEEDPEAEHFKQIGEAFLAGGADTDPEIMRGFLKIAGSPLPEHGPLPDNMIAAAHRAQGTDRRMRPASPSERSATRTFRYWWPPARTTDQSSETWMRSRMPSAPSG